MVSEMNAMPLQGPEPEYVDIKTVARIYGYTDWRSVRNRAQRGELPGAFKAPPQPHGRWLVDIKELRKAWGK
jgi:hypothetical protein